LTYRPFGALKAALLDIVTQNMTDGDNSNPPSLDADAVRTHLRTIGLDSIADQAVRAVTHAGDRFTAIGADPAVVAAGFNHALGIQRHRVDLARDLDLAERAWHAHQTEENRTRIDELKALQSQRIDMEPA
jgi:hypothetical protein